MERALRNKFTLLFAVTYMISYITRINYGTVISEMVTGTGLTKSMLSLAVTGSFITYGVGQVVSGIVGDKLSPKKLISVGLLVSVIMNVLIPVCTNHYQMLAVWCVNGFAQAFMWPPMVRIMTTIFSSEEYKTACVKVSWGSSMGTIVLYLLSPLIIAVSGWKAVFFFSAICGIIMIFVWNKLCVYKEEKRAEVKEKQSGNIAVLFKPFMIGIMLAIVLQGMLRDGVTTWMPSYIAETYNLSNIISILTGVLLPLFSIFTFYITSYVYKNNIKNVVTCAGTVFGVGVVSALALVLFTGKSVVLSILFSALLTGAMHGVNLLLICMVPHYFVKYGNVSTVSGVLNSCTYIGSAVSTYGIALLSEKFNWSFTLFVWLMIALSGTLVCFLCVKPWKTNMEA